MSFTPTHVSLDGVNLSDPEFWIADRAHRENVFAMLRDEQPISFHSEWVFEDSPFPPDPATSP
ncbi:MAG: hypothetical protein R2705_14035 [Ilumatobacteraceae bacterium]